MKSILFQLGYDDEKYLSFLKPILIGKCKLHLSNIQPDAIMEVVMRAREKGCTAIATTSPKLLQLLLNKVGEKQPSLDDYAGSIIERYGFEFLILNPVEHLITVPYGKFLYERYFSKLLRPEDWLQIPEFRWSLFDPAQTQSLLTLSQEATFISVDIETIRNDPQRTIACCGLSFVSIDTVSNSVAITTTVIPLTEDYNIAVLKKLLSGKRPKVFQNGKYDNAYFLRYGIEVTNWAYDTLILFHAWYSELPKRLDFITSFMLRKWQYWKDESSTGNLMDYYAYNGKDCFTTAMSLIALLNEMPQWALDNYLMEFPLVFPCFLAEMTGIKADPTAFSKLKGQLDEWSAAEIKKLQVMVANSNFNPRSSPQTVRLFALLGSSDITSTGPAQRDKVASRHPLNKKIISSITKYRKDMKLTSTYTDEDKIWLGRIFYALDPNGTDTSRMASKESQFWCGLQIHNIPRNRKDINIKDMFIADDGYNFGEADLEQNEARGTAYLSGDKALIAAVENKERDFHGHNASEFFGIPYEQIMSASKEVLNEEIRDLSKRTNHGANYNMGKQVMLDTMGIENVLRAKRLLRLPDSYSLLDVTGHLLAVYAKTYPVVKGPWYDKCKSDVIGSGFLIGPTGWHRRCFSDPTKSKHALNSYVAHPPQSLAAQLLNRSYIKVFYNVWMPNSNDFKLGPQIHDSILFQYRVGREDLAWQVKECMEQHTPVTDTFGIVRDLFVPVALKGNSNRWSMIKKMKPTLIAA